MWRSKKGFNKFVNIVRNMEFLTTGQIRRVYDYTTRQYEDEILSVDLLDYFVASIRHEAEEDKIFQLRNWVRMRCNNSTRLFKETRMAVEYFDRLSEYNA